MEELEERKGSSYSMCLMGSPAEKRLGPAVNVIAMNAMHYKLNTATGKERLLISFFLD